MLQVGILHIFLGMGFLVFMYDGSFFLPRVMWARKGYRKRLNLPKPDAKTTWGFPSSKGWNQN